MCATKEATPPLLTNVYANRVGQARVLVIHLLRGGGGTYVRFLQPFRLKAQSGPCAKVFRNPPTLTHSYSLTIVGS